MTETEKEILVQIQPTPNPMAWKFIVNRPVLTEGKASFSNTDEAYGNRLALDLLSLDGVKQVHFFQNVITITGRLDVDEFQLHPQATSVIQTRLPAHNPDFGKKDALKSKRESLPPDVRRMEEILDNTVRPGLQGDGGDIEIVKLDEKKLYVHYEGACGTCPSSTTATLQAIEGLIREEFPEIEVIPI